ncbi:pentatricopeptide repeat-containing protein At4g21190 [Ananas comosus]|uniref:Pentatricopeptide repeat-containing protein At4g21190 n=1 Tax=Ananas comosus TaxID=4615 RepID=A0A6P5G8R6_ANACO|nr:pentatricopeptide repeat-containing protein At4g21190 [Ananas comosus]
MGGASKLLALLSASKPDRFRVIAGNGSQLLYQNGVESTRRMSSFLSGGGGENNLGAGRFCCRSYVTSTLVLQSRSSAYREVVEDQVYGQRGSKATLPAERNAEMINQIQRSENEPVIKQVGKNITSTDKRRFLVNTLLDLKDSKEAVYGTLDAWVAWEQTFPLSSLKKALLVLEKEEQWHKVVQVVKWMLSKGQGTTMGTYEQLIRALEKDNRAEEAHKIWEKKMSHDLHSVPWRFCDLMLSIYYRNNMLERLVKLFKGLEAYDRKPPSKSVVRKAADAYEMLGLIEEKNRVLEKYGHLFSKSSDERQKKSRKARKVAQKVDDKADNSKQKRKEASDETSADSGPSDVETDACA